jgi:molecular chaperone GrpE
VTTDKPKPSGAAKKPIASTPQQQSRAKADIPQTTPKSKAAAKPQAGALGQLDKVQGRVTELEAALQTERQRVQDLQTKLAYLQAEFQNSMKTLERRQSQFIEQANRDLVLHLLPVLDDLERARIMVPLIKENQPFIEGLAMVLEGFRSALESAGVKPIDCQGQAFDPLRHEAVAREETTQYAPNTIVEELQKGYLLKGNLLRPSLVRIAVPHPPVVEKDAAQVAQNRQHEGLDRDQPNPKDRKRVAPK